MRGRAFVFGDDVNTDYIAPGGFSTDGLVEKLMEPIRPDFVDEVEPGDVIVAGENFGCGSSRETAPMAIQEAAIDAVIAESFSRLYYRNSINLGLPALICPDVTDRVTEGDELAIDVDDSIIENCSSGESFGFEPVSEELRAIFEAGGLFEYYAEHPEGLKDA